MPATSPSSGSFDAAQWEARMARSAAPTTAQPAVPLTNPYSEQLRRACRLLRHRLNALEVPPQPLTERDQRRLSHQASRLSRAVERLVVASKRYEEEHRPAPYFAASRSAA